MFQFVTVFQQPALTVAASILDLSTTSAVSKPKTLTYILAFSSTDSVTFRCLTLHVLLVLSGVRKELMIQVTAYHPG